MGQTREGIGTDELGDGPDQVYAVGGEILKRRSISKALGHRPISERVIIEVNGGERSHTFEAIRGDRGEVVVVKIQRLEGAQSGQTR